MNPKYQKILYLAHHQSSTRKHMSLEERAAQFSPFAALTGYDDQIEDTNRFREEKIELSEVDLEALNETIHILLTHIKEELWVRITYYDVDEEKYVSKEGVVKHIYEMERSLVLKDRTKISFDNILVMDLKR